MLSPSADQLIAALAVAAVYLLLVRMMDVNEREPLWAVLMVFGLGAIAAVTLDWAVNPVILALERWPAAAWREGAVFLAIALASRIFAAIAGLRGWSEISDQIDGILYGFSAGLGFGCGEALVRLTSATTLPAFDQGVSVAMFAAVALAGLAQGVFGGIVGAGFGAASVSASRARVLWPLAALGVAIVAHASHDMLAFGDALGPNGLLRRNAALALSIAAVASCSLYGLLAERRAIAEELSGEVGSGSVTGEELAVLRSAAKRHLWYAGRILSGRVDQARRRAALHNRQVMLALALTRARGARADADRQRARAEADALRASIAAMRARLRDVPSPLAGERP